MATTNYSLPTLDNTALFDLVTDYNALANATDAALASVAELVPTETISEMQGQISALQNLTGSQGSQITALQSQMTTANGNITTVQSGLQTANSSIGTLQTGLQSTNTKIEKLNNSFVLSSTIYNGAEITANALSDSHLNVMSNADGTMINVFGLVKFSSTQNRVAIPGASGYYGIKTLIKIPSIKEAHTFDVSGVTNVDDAVVKGLATAFAVGSDGYIYLWYGSAKTTPTISKSCTLSIINSIKILGKPVEFTGA